MRRTAAPALVALLLMVGAPACTNSSEGRGHGEESGGDLAGLTPDPGPGDVGITTLALSEVDGATAPRSFTLTVDEAAVSASLVVDGSYIGRDDEAPLAFALTLSPGRHEVRVRLDAGGENTEVRHEATITVVDDDAGAVTTTSVAPVPLPATQPPGGGLVVDSVAEIRDALATAAPGTVIVVADGEYEFKPRLVASASGTPDAPITLRGTRNAVLRTKNASGDYGLHITGDHWRIEGLTIAHATKGIVLDNSTGTTIDNVEVHDIGDEAIHFRTCSSDGVLRNSYIHHTGRNSAQYGEGVYVGSANSNWSKYQCTDPIEGQTQGDNTERVLIEDNLFEDITAEGADLKEGTDSGTLRRNTFRRVGASGMNSADSAVDAKGNGWLIEDNTVSDTNAPWDDDGTPRPSEFQDAYQTHNVYNGYGTSNTFRRNHVTGPIPGFVIGLYPALNNTATCDNTATGTHQALIGDNGQPTTCSPP